MMTRAMTAGTEIGEKSVAPAGGSSHFKSAASMDSRASGYFVQMADLADLLDFLEKEVDKKQEALDDKTLKPEDVFDDLAWLIVNTLDRTAQGTDGAEVLGAQDGLISVGEVHDLYENAGDQDAPNEDAAWEGKAQYESEGKGDGETHPAWVLWSFSQWVKNHPWYKEPEVFWADLSEDLEVNIEEFTQSMYSILTKFVKKKNTNVTQIGSSAYDDKNFCALRSAIWRMPKSGELKHRENRDLVIKFRVVGPKAHQYFRQLERYQIKVEGKTRKYKPMVLIEKTLENPEQEKSQEELGEFDLKLESDVNDSFGGTADEQRCTLIYKDVPFNKVMYFKFAGMQGKKDLNEFLEISFRGHNPGAPDDKAKEVFADLDVQMSNGISRKELSPPTGESMEAAEQAMLSFRVPLAQIQDISADEVKIVGKGDDKKKIIHVKVNPQYATKAQWSSLKTGMNPEWECERPDKEAVSFCMLPAYWDLWQTVIKECAMNKPQEWVLFYDGGYREHDDIRGYYMRDGYGMQKWANGQLYVGNWANHVYDGDGTLWESAEDAEIKALPIYSGQHKAGVRCGEGVLNWEQDRFDMTGKSAFTRVPHTGVAKCYHGRFEDGLFYGRGKLILRGANVSLPPSAQAVSSRTGIVKVRQPRLEPSEILRYVGDFKSEWQQVHDDFLNGQFDPSFIATHMDPVEGDFCEPPDDKGIPTGRLYPTLRLESLTKNDEAEGKPKLQRYFERTMVDGQAGPQKAGLPMPDIALLFYQLRLTRIVGGQRCEVPAETMHFFNGNAQYADGCTYEGFFKGGFPDGHGKLTQYDGTEAEGENRNELAVYEGQWKDGKRHGHGKYTVYSEQVPQYVYDGQWADNSRQGNGRQIITDYAGNQKAFGYSEYDGEWLQDRRHGKGIMLIPPGRDGDSCYTFEGTFQNGRREGYGTVTREGFEHPVYKGLWREDCIYATDTQPAWSHLNTSIYYGAMTEEGERSGLGQLFRKEAMDDEDFKAKFDSTSDEVRAAMVAETLAETLREQTLIGHSWDALDKPTTLKLYQGAWLKNLPNGNGIQFFKWDKDGKKGGEEVLSIYTGQFLDGRKHGRGTFDGVDKTGRPWKYKEIPGTAHNWANDVMHGIAIVEERDSLHENVIYTNGKCNMPGLPEVPGLNGINGQDLLVVLLGDKADKILQGEEETMGTEHSEKTAKAKKAKAKAKAASRSMTSLRPEEMKVLQSQVTTLNLRKQNQEIRNPDQVHAEYEDDLGALIRQPTDLLLEHEDVWVDGGEGANELLNGLYFKMTGTFGYPIYKHARTRVVDAAVKASQSSSCCSRPQTVEDHEGEVYEFDFMYMYKALRMNVKDPELWCISETPEKNQKEKLEEVPTVSAYVESSSHYPGDIKEAWYVYHESTGLLQKYGQEVQDARQGFLSSCCASANTGGKINEIKVHSIVGFEVSGVPVEYIAQIPTLFLRCHTMYYGRPVYESENCGQYLYWQAKDTEAFSGIANANLSAPGQVIKLEESEAKKRGYWCISSQVGLSPSSNECVAWCDDMNMSPPFTIPEEMQKKVKGKSAPPSSDTTEKTWFLRERPDETTIEELKEQLRQDKEDPNPNLEKVLGKRVFWSPGEFAPLKVDYLVEVEIEEFVFNEEDVGHVEEDIMEQVNLLFEYGSEKCKAAAQAYKETFNLAIMRNKLKELKADEMKEKERLMAEERRLEEEEEKARLAAATKKGGGGWFSSKSKEDKANEAKLQETSAAEDQAEAKTNMAQKVTIAITELERLIEAHRETEAKFYIDFLDTQGSTAFRCNFMPDSTLKLNSRIKTAEGAAQAKELEIEEYHGDDGEDQIVEVRHSLDECVPGDQVWKKSDQSPKPLYTIVSIDNGIKVKDDVGQESTIEERDVEFPGFDGITEAVEMQMQKAISTTVEEVQAAKFQFVYRKDDKRSHWEISTPTKEGNYEKIATFAHRTDRKIMQVCVSDNVKHKHLWCTPSEEDPRMRQNWNKAFGPRKGMKLELFFHDADDRTGVDLLDGVVGVPSNPRISQPDGAEAVTGPTTSSVPGLDDEEENPDKPLLAIENR